MRTHSDRSRSELIPHGHAIFSGFPLHYHPLLLLDTFPAIPLCPLSLPISSLYLPFSLPPTPASLFHHHRLAPCFHEGLDREDGYIHGVTDHLPSMADELEKRLLLVISRFMPEAVQQRRAIVGKAHVHRGSMPTRCQQQHVGIRVHEVDEEPREELGAGQTAQAVVSFDASIQPSPLTVDCPRGQPPKAVDLLLPLSSNWMSASLFEYTALNDCRCSKTRVAAMQGSERNDSRTCSECSPTMRLTMTEGSSAAARKRASSGAAPAGRATNALARVLALVLDERGAGVTAEARTEASTRVRFDILYIYVSSTRKETADSYWYILPLFDYSGKWVLISPGSNTGKL